MTVMSLDPWERVSHREAITVLFVAFSQLCSPFPAPESRGAHTMKNLEIVSNYSFGKCNQLELSFLH